jgi:hypothetical protein
MGDGTLRVAVESMAFTAPSQASLASIRQAEVWMGDYAAAALTTFGVGLETTNCKTGLRRLGLATRTAATSALKALLSLWRCCRCGAEARRSASHNRVPEAPSQPLYRREL